MAHSSSSVGKQPLDVPLVDCPRCVGARLLLLTSRTNTTAGQVFVKCPNNQPWVKAPKRCHIFKWLDEYYSYLAEIGIERGRTNEEWKFEDGNMNVDYERNSQTDGLKLQIAELNEAIRKISRHADGHDCHACCICHDDLYC